MQQQLWQASPRALLRREARCRHCRICCVSRRPSTSDSRMSARHSYLMSLNDSWCGHLASALCTYILPSIGRKMSQCLCWLACIGYLTELGCFLVCGGSSPSVVGIVQAPPLTKRQEALAARKQREAVRGQEALFGFAEAAEQAAKEDADGPVAGPATPGAAPQIMGPSGSDTTITQAPSGPLFLLASWSHQLHAWNSIGVGALQRVYRR